MPATKKISSDDVRFNRSLLAYGESTHSRPSWLANSLKVKNGTTSVDYKDEEEADIEGDDDEAGLGCVVAEAQLNQDRQSLSANERLRKQLLGKNATVSNTRRDLSTHKPNTLVASKPRPQAKPLNSHGNDDDDDDDDDTGGRTVATAKNVTSLKSQQSEDAQHNTEASSKKRKGTYLDEILTQRQGKKSRNQKNADRNKN